MRLLRYGAFGFEKPGCLDALSRLRDLSDVIADISSETLSPDYLKYLCELDINHLPLVNTPVRIGPCIGQVGKFICVGLNYQDHAHEVGMQVPKEPILFSKVTSAISGPYDDIVIPAGSTHTDWEVELGIVIGQQVKRVSEEEALQCVAGYCVVNDVSERQYQLGGTGQWMKGKSCDSFGPIGPWLVTADEILDPHQLSIWLEVDGKKYQDSHTSRMIFKIPFLISYISQFFTLYPGDIISTGTPAGIGHAQKPHPIYLAPHQRVRLGVDRLGEQSHITIAE